MVAHFARQQRMPVPRPVMITIAEKPTGTLNANRPPAFINGAHGHRGGRQIGLPDRRITDDGADWPVTY
jgi:hypothetical protein